MSTVERRRQSRDREQEQERERKRARDDSINQLLAKRSLVSLEEREAIRRRLEHLD